MKLVVDQLFARTSLTHFLTVYFSTPLNDTVAREAGFAARVVLHDDIEPTGVRVRRVRFVRAAGPLLAPGAGGAVAKTLAALVRAAPDVVEESRYTPETATVAFTLTAAHSTRLHVDGTVRFSAENGGVRRRIAAEVTLALPALLRAPAERFLTAQLQALYARHAVTLRAALDQPAGDGAAAHTMQSPARGPAVVAPPRRSP